MTKKFYYVVVYQRGAFGAIVPVQLASNKVYSQKKNAVKHCRKLTREYPKTEFLVSWQWDDSNGRNEYLKMINRGYFIENNHVGNLG